MKETETHECQFLSNAAARLPVQQPKTRSAYAARGHYRELDSIYYGNKLKPFTENYL